MDWSKLIASLWRLLFLTSPFSKIHHPWFKSTLYVEDGALFDTLGNKVILRGINYPLLDDWSFPADDKLNEIEQTGANAVRIQWYVNYPPPKPGEDPRPSYSLADVDAVLDKCRSLRMIPILMLMDYTSKPDVDALNTVLVPWWVRADVVAVLQKHRRYLILNLANELGSYRWAQDPPTALTAFKAAYQQAIATIRGAGLRMPVMIDAPDGGTSIDAFLLIGKDLIDNDPKPNLLLSVHAYWAGHDRTPELLNALNAKLPIVFGEIANKQDEKINGVDYYCYYALDRILAVKRPDHFAYQPFLRTLATHEVGWLAWSWGPDNCDERNMTVHPKIGGGGTFNDLTPYGHDIVYNAGYGLRGSNAPAVRTPALP